ncbi:hypothetical protein QBC34DRAFT_13127 [Podospora aff. communis PSN243]|uniref:Uncharacterized protein n=1 Tax=Podospora aff. communis PSN243 TaxID=3040156 RepID=A0AAV9H9I6_9PEZI|nr:hypothetical protein QBC34DRAFT_13127 [Podospora aff. communis PSN243]
MRRVTLPKTEGSEDVNQVPAPTPVPQENLDTPAKLVPHQNGKRSLLPPELMEIVAPSLKVGLTVGTLGLFTGAAAGIIRSAPPALFSIVMGGQMFALSSSYYASRLVALKAFKGENGIRPVDKVKASTFAGGVAGMVGGVLRGPKNIVPGMIFFSLFGGAGQLAANAINWNTNPEESATEGFLKSKWSPVTFLTDEEYQKILEEKLLRVDVEIALVDDNINELRAAEEQSRKPTAAKDSNAFGAGSE